MNIIPVHAFVDDQVIHVNPRAILAIRAHAQGSLLEMADRTGLARIQVYHVREKPEDIRTIIGGP
jgi:hypothetical protein